MGVDGDRRGRPGCRRRARSQSARTVDPLGGQRGDVGEDDDVELVEIDRAGGAAAARRSMPASSSLVMTRTEVPLSSRSPGRRRGLEVEDFIVVTHRGAGPPSTMSTRDAIAQATARTQPGDRRSRSASPDSATKQSVGAGAGGQGGEESAWSCVRRP